MKACVVGYGRMGKIHHRALTELGYTVTTIDPNGNADYCAVPHRRYDAVAIAVPIQHIAEAAAEWAGYTGHLLVEKPFAANLQEAEALSHTLAGQNVAVGYCERFNPCVIALQRAVRAIVSAPERVLFTRWNDRPSWDVELDLRSHDVDLAACLGVAGVAEFDTRADVRRLHIAGRRRHVEVGYGGGVSVCADLMAHSASPVRDQWREFLSGAVAYLGGFGAGSVATMGDAVGVHGVLEAQWMAVAA